MFGETINKLRKEKGYTAQQLADYLGVQLRTYRKYESNDRTPTFESLVKIADYFNVSTDYLLGRTTNPYFDAKSFDE